MSELDLDVARWLVSEDGLETVRSATSRLDRGDDELAVLTRLRTHLDDARRTAAALAAAVARRRARSRWIDADQLLFTRSALEQASDPALSRWRARRFEGHDVHDLCSGVGGDTAALARVAREVVAVDLDAARLTLLRHNLDVHDLDVQGRHVTASVGDALRTPIRADGVVHVDPARRHEGRRRQDLRSTLPPVDDLVAAYRHVSGMAVVCAPGTDVDDPALPGDVEVEYLQLGTDLVEAVAWTGVLRRDGVVASATLLPLMAPDVDDDQDAGAEVHHLERVGARSAKLAVGEVGDHLVQVATAAIRARLHDEVGGAIGARRLADHRALLTTDGAPPPSPWYRARPVLAVLPARPRAVKAWLGETDRGPVEIVLHGIRADPLGWWRDLGRPPRGPRGVRIELVRRDDDSVAVVTDDASDPSS